MRSGAETFPSGAPKVPERVTRGAVLEHSTTVGKIGPAVLGAHVVVFITCSALIAEDEK